MNTKWDFIMGSVYLPYTQLTSHIGILSIVFIHINTLQYDLMSKPTLSTPPTEADESVSRAPTPAHDVSYDQSHYPSLFAAEDHHFWFQTRNKVISTLVQQLMVEYPTGYRFLEIGCGNG